jgi:hypothetical protein
MLMAAFVAAMPPLVARCDDIITPFLGKKISSACQDLRLDQRNVVGFMSVADAPDTDTVSAHVLFRSGGRSSRLDLRLSRKDADQLAEEVRALIRRERSRPIRFQTARAADGACQVSRVVG